MTVKFVAKLRWLAILLVALLSLPGCGGKNGTGNGGDNNGGEGEGKPAGPIVRKVDLELLGDYLPPIDGLVEVAPPKDWQIQPRQSPYLVRFSGSAARINPLPRIRLTAEPSNFDAPNVTEENLSEFLAHVEANLKDAGKEKNLLEPPTAMIIGGRPCVRYVLAGLLRLTSTRKLDVETQRLVTVVGGKQFDFDLQVVEGQIPDSRDRSYAVLAGTKFLQETAEPPPTPKKEEDEPKEYGESNED